MRHFRELLGQILRGSAGATRGCTVQPSGPCVTRPRAINIEISRLAAPPVPRCIDRHPLAPQTQIGRFAPVAAEDRFFGAPGVRRTRAASCAMAACAQSSSRLFERLERLRIISSHPRGRAQLWFPAARCPRAATAGVTVEGREARHRRPTLPRRIPQREKSDDARYRAGAFAKAC